MEWLKQLTGIVVRTASSDFRDAVDQKGVVFIDAKACEGVW